MRMYIYPLMTNKGKGYYYLRNYELRVKIEKLARENEGYKELMYPLIDNGIYSGTLTARYKKNLNDLYSLSKKLKGITDDSHFPELKEFFVRNHINVNLV